MVVTSSPEEGFAALAGEGSEMEPGRGLIANTTELILHWIHFVDLKQNTNETGGHVSDCKGVVLRSGMF